MIQRDAIILFFRIPQIDRGAPDNPLAAVAWDDFNALYSAMFGDLFRISCQFPDIDVLVYRDADEISDDFFINFRHKVRLYPLQQTPVNEQMQQALMDAFQGKYQKVVIFLDNNPLVTRALIRKIFNQLGYEDDCIVVGPTHDGKCSLLGMKSYHDALLKSEEGDPLYRPNVLMKNVCSTPATVFTLDPVPSYDMSANLIELRRKIDALDRDMMDYPSRTHDIFKMFDKKYKLKKYIQ